MDNREKRLIESFTTVGGVLVIIGAAVQITGWVYAPYIFLAGSLLFSCGQFADRYDGDDRIMKHLRFQQVIGACFILLTAVLMFSGQLHDMVLANVGMNRNLRTVLVALTARNNWILTLTIGAVTELYTSFRMDSLSRAKDKQ